MHLQLKHWLFPSWQSRKRMLRRELIIFAVLAYAALALSYIPVGSAAQQPGALLWFDYICFYVRVFQFHIDVAMLSVGIIALLCRWRKTAVATLPLILFTLTPTALSYLPKRTSTTQPNLSLLTCNLLYINSHIPELANTMLQLEPDVICVQELTPTIDAALRDALGRSYPHISTFPQMDAFGVGIYSRLPFLAEPGAAIPDRDGVPEQRAQFLVAGTTVTLFNMHLYPPGSLLDYRDMKWQVVQITSAVAQETSPVIVSGDFNFPETTRQARQITGAGLRDAYSTYGFGRGATWPAIGPLRFFPGLRLDHIYLGSAIECTSIQVHNAPGSDHRLLFARLAVRQ